MDCVQLTFAGIVAFLAVVDVGVQVWRVWARSDPRLAIVAPKWDILHGGPTELADADLCLCNSGPTPIIVHDLLAIGGDEPLLFNPDDETARGYAANPLPMVIAGDSHQRVRVGFTPQMRKDGIVATYSTTLRRHKKTRVEIVVDRRLEGHRPKPRR